MSNVFFTSDEHYDHGNVISYCNRPFADLSAFAEYDRANMPDEVKHEYKKVIKEGAEQMTEAMIENHNKVVTNNNDRVYHLGDFAVGSPARIKEIFSRLRGQHFLVKGNHDGKDVLALPWQNIYETKGTRINGRYIWMSHYPHRSWNRAYHGSWHIFGHVHSRCMPWGKSCDVGVDSWNYTPVSFEQLSELMQELPMNCEYSLDSFVPEGKMWRGFSNTVEDTDT